MTVKRRCGHDLTDENTRWRRTPDGGRKSDGCRLCANEYKQRWKTKQRRQAGFAPRLRADDSANGYKRCPKCRETKALEDFSPRPGRTGGYNQGRASHCKPCAVQTKREYRIRHPDVIPRMNKRSWERVKQQVFAAYGGSHPRCACCGEDEQAFLAIDHVNNDGAAHRRMLRSTSHVYRDIIRRGFPPGFQVLCFNCNFAKSRGGCPHQRAQVVAAAQVAVA